MKLSSHTTSGARVTNPLLFRAEIISTYNRLIYACRQAEAGYRYASETFEDHQSRRLLMLFSQQRARFAAELATQVMRLGGTPGLSQEELDDVGFETGSSRFEDCCMAEDRSLREYEYALQRPLPTGALFLLRIHYSHIRHAHDRLIGLMPSVAHHLDNEERQVA